jgi:hypothetical protein
VLDDAAVHIDDVQSAVRGEGEIHRTKPLVGRRQELSPHLAIGFVRGETAAAVPKHDAADEIDGGIHDEHVAVQLGWQTIAAIDHRRAHRRKFRERAVRTQNPELIAAIDAARRPDGPHVVELAIRSVERLITAARAQKIRVPHVVMRRD